MSHERHREEKALTSGPRLPTHPLHWSHQRPPAETRGGKVASVLGDMTARLDALLQEADVLDSEYAAAAETLAAAEGEVAAQKVAAFEKVLDKFGELEHEAQLQESYLRAFGDCLLAVEKRHFPQCSLITALPQCSLITALPRYRLIRSAATSRAISGRRTGRDRPLRSRAEA